MAAISVVTFGSPHKILQNSNTANRSDIMIVRKTADKTATRKSRREITRVSNPTPIAVARRNARERNRVKQVNNGFAALRQHIPAEIAAAFEQQVGHGRSGNKKLSKVETLRMAVEYIRSLEEILSSDDSSDNGTNNSISSRTSTITYPSPSFANISDDQNSSDRTSPRTFQYIRISENDTYQFITSTNQFATFEDEENIQPIVDNLSSNGDVFVHSPLAEMVFESYTGDEHSLSPGPGPNTHMADVSSYAQHSRPFNITLPPIEVLQPRNIIQSNILISPSLSSNSHSLSPKLLSPNHTQSFHPTSVITSVAHHSILYSPQSDDCPIKLETSDTDLALEDGVVKTEEMVDVMDWWQNNGKLTTSDQS